MEPPSRNISKSATLRMSLKRGYAKAVISHAKKSKLDVKSLFDELRTLRRNAKAQKRLILRLRKNPSVVSSNLLPNHGIAIVYREAITQETKHSGETLFLEDALIFTLVEATISRLGRSMGIVRASFCVHAIERLIERTDYEIGPEFSAIIDREAAHILKEMKDDNEIAHNNDFFISALKQGVWAGSLDDTAPDEEWRVRKTSAMVPTFSVRTFLSPDEMKPSVWLEWQDDPTITRS